MPTIPTPQSRSQILGNMISALLSRLGIPSLPVGDPILSILEAAAESDVRVSQDIFQLLNSISLDRATGAALSRIGADEGLTRYAESPSNGLVTITDSSFDKVQSTIFQGTAAPIIGSQTINVASAFGWPTSGNLYIGRGTNQYEGPIAYTATVDNTSYWTITLTTATQRFHNLGESVILAQGGDRSIIPGTVVQTPQGNVGSAVSFAVLYEAVIPDGEVSVSNVTVVAQTPGVIGNVAAGSISAFSTAPFTGATVTNPAPFTNGRATEEDKDFRERIRYARATRARGTPLAIKNAVVGTISAEENKRVISASVVTREGYPTTLYIDDGQGYEEKTEGIGIETIVDSASGGERYFSLANGRPVAKAFAITQLSAPFSLSSGAILAVNVGGVLFEHAFSSTEFRSISNASAYEVVASINGNPTCPFSARTAEEGSKVAIFSDEDTNEDIEVVEPTAGTDANVYLGFSVGKNDTIRLYKNDRLLNKDGELASVASKAQSSWATLSDGETITIVVDGVNISGISDTYTINDSDFVNAGTVYNTVSASNSLASWAQVLNYKIPGITAEASSGYLTVTSNKGRSSAASIVISGGTLTSNGMFDIVSDYGQEADYTLNRNLGQIRLESVLAAGDKLTAGSSGTRAFLEGSALTTVDFTTDAELWFAVDGSASIIDVGLTAGTTVTYSITASPSWGKRVRITTTATAWTNVEQGDWLIINDPALPTEAGAFRIVTKHAGNLWIEVERPSTFVSPGAVALTTGGMSVIRTTTEPQRVTIPAGTNYTALTLVQELNNQLVGATASVYKTTRIRVRTNTFDLFGDIALVAQNTEAEKMLLTVSDAVDNLSSHIASVISGNQQAGTPVPISRVVTTVTSDTVITGTGFSTVNPGHLLVATRPADDALGRWSNSGHISSIQGLSGSTLTIRNPVLQDWLPDDIVYEAYPYALNAQDQLVVQVDDDVLTKRYDINMYRRARPTTASYGATNFFKDVDNGLLSLANGFGTDFEWNDFAVYMKARAKSHLSGGLNTTKTILWRYYRFGQEGNVSRIQYRYPDAASQTVNVTTEHSLTTQYTDIKVLLPTGAARTGTTLRTSTKIGVAATSVAASLYTYYYVFNLAIASASRTSNVTTLTLTLPGPITDHGLVIGNQIYVTSSSGSFTSGVKIITAKTASTVSYAETAADVGATANIGTLSNDISGIATLSGSTVVAGDIIGVQSGTGLASPFGENATRIGTLDVNGRYVQTTSDQSNSVSTVLTWYQLNDTTKLSFYPINSVTNTASLITSGVNALSNVSVSAVAVGGGTGQVAYATYEVAPDGEGAADPWYYLADGLNYVQSHNAPTDPAHFSFTFKNAITASLAANSDWDNEEVRLVPTTAANVVDYLNSTATSGLSSVAEITLSTDGQSPQISSGTLGSAGSIQVAGGSANSISSSAKNSATLLTSDYYYLTFPTSDLDGLSGDMMVALENSIPVPKVGRIGATTQLSSLDTLGNFTLATTTAWDYASGTSVETGDWQFIKQGNQVQVRFLGGPWAGSMLAGDIAVIKLSSGSTANEGTFRVIRQASNLWFWIENADCVEEIATGSVAFLDYNSILPGDTLSINTTLWGANNVGDFVVESIDLPGPFGGTGSTYKFKVTSAMTAVTGPITLGVSSPLVQVVEASASKLIRRVVSIMPNALDSTASDVTFEVIQGYLKVGAFAGTILKPIDKLAFSTLLASGIDGYTHNTGLLAEANKVIYGDESDTSGYPGYVAAGAKVNISGPLIKRIQLGLGIRIKTNISSRDIFDRVKSEVAAVVNNTNIGTPVAISDIIKAAQNVNGVSAVSVLSPTYDVSNDLISVQPFEKPLVLNVDTDILISLIGN